MEELLRGVMLSHDLEFRDERWLDRYYSIPELVASALRKYRGEATAKRKPLARLACRLIRERRPGEEVRAAVTAEAAALGIDAVSVKEIIAWAAKQEMTRREAPHA